jgi:hypothetical protein
MNETPYRLAYEASVRAIEVQARVLEGVRSRAGTMIPVSATEAYEEVALRVEELYDGNRLEDLVAKNEGSGTAPRPKPQWPDISKTDTRGG